MTPFKPKGSRPEWRIIYDELLQDAEFGSIISYADLDRVLGRDFRKSRNPIYQATRHLGLERRRWLSPVTNMGYRVIEAREHMGAADKHKKKAKRQLGFVIKVGNATDITKLTPDELSRFDSQHKVNAMLFMVAVHHEKRLKRLEEVLAREGLLSI